MTTAHASTFAPRLRPLVAALATLFAASTATWDTHAALALPQAPTNIVVDNCNDSGAGSLRAALNNAVSDDTIDLSQLSCSRISLTTGALAITQAALTISGPGQSSLTLDGGDVSAILYATGHGTLTVNGMSIVNGYRSGANADVRGGCVHADGNLILQSVNVSHCRITSVADYNALGGALFAHGTLSLASSTVSDSSIATHGTGYAKGGGLYALGGLSMSYITVSQNVASSNIEGRSVGGGVFARGNAVIGHSTISGNMADRSGGLDLASYGNFAAIINSSTVSGNTATRIGGISAASFLYLFNSTIAFNTSSVFTDTTGNHFAAGVHIWIGGEMDSTIISNNANTGVSRPTVDVTGVASATFFGSHNNVMFCDITCPADTTHEDPGLLPLQDNGGLTRTHVPTPGSWDRFGGSNVLGSVWDQRGPGFPRAPAGDRIEIGAVQINSDIVFVNGFN